MIVARRDLRPLLRVCRAIDYYSENSILTATALSGELFDCDRSRLNKYADKKKYVYHEIDPIEKNTRALTQIKVR